MLEISNNGIITLSRGDYAEIPLFINQGNKMYPIRYSLLKDPSASIVFAVMAPQQIFERALIKKLYNAKSSHTKQKDLIIVLEPKDTIGLQPGKYFYSVRINLMQHGHYCQKTIIPEKMFIIKE